VAEALWLRLIDEEYPRALDHLVEGLELLGEGRLPPVPKELDEVPVGREVVLYGPLAAANDETELPEAEEVKRVRTGLLRRVGGAGSRRGPSSDACL
jgi:hypothetical protein